MGSITVIIFLLLEADVRPVKTSDLKPSILRRGGSGGGAGDGVRGGDGGISGCPELAKTEYLH